MLKEKKSNKPFVYGYIVKIKNLWLRVSENVHFNFFHANKHVRVVRGPYDVPYVASFKIGKLIFLLLGSHIDYS